MSDADPHDLLDRVIRAQREDAELCHLLRVYDDRIRELERRLENVENACRELDQKQKSPLGNWQGGPR